MVNQGRRPGGRRPGGGRTGGGRSGGRTPARTPRATSKTPPRAPKAAAEPVTAERAAEEPRVFRLGIVPGATPGRWIDTWKRRMPHVPIELVPIEYATQHASLSEVDAALIRLPLADDRLHIIPLYDEVPVVVAPVDSHLLAVDELGPDDLTGEVLLTPLDDVLGPLDLPGTVAPAFDPLATTADAIATVATGVGIVVVPMSLARLHHRKDVDHRPLRHGPSSTVAFVWAREATTPDIETFVGIIRGRTENSSR